MFKRKKLPTAVKLALAATMTVALSGCLVEGDTTSSITSSATGNNSEVFASPTGDVFGVVQDTDGNPVSGARVYLGAKATTTSAGGTYEFKNVPVTNVTINDQGTASNALGALRQVLQVSIVPPTGYLGATVELTPQAVIDFGDAGACNDTSGTAVTLTCDSSTSTHTFIDGFAVSAGTAVLPTIGDGGVTVTGVLRDNVTGVIVPNTSISLEMLRGVNSTAASSSAQEQAHNGVTFSYATPNFTVTTDANGVFSFAGIPADSNLLPVVGGYNIPAAAGVWVGAQVNLATVTDAYPAITTVGEDEVVNVGTIVVNPIGSADFVAPYVTRVESVVTTTAIANTITGNAMFNDDMDTSINGTGIVIHFSEPMDTTATTVGANEIGLIDRLDNSIRIFAYTDTTANGVVDANEQDGTHVALDSATVSADGRTLTVFTVAPIAQGLQVHVNLLDVDFQDIAGNNLVAAAVNANTTSPTTVSYDIAVATASTDFGYTRLVVDMFQETNITAPSVTPSQLATDDTGVNENPLIVAQTKSFNDIDDSTAGIQQLNSAENNDTVTADLDAANRLSALYVAEGAAGGTVTVDDALVTFTPSSAASYVIDILSETTGLSIFTPGGSTLAIPAGTLINATAVGAVAAGGQVITVNDATSDVTFIIGGTGVANGPKPGDIVTITPRDSFGYPGSATTLLLRDNVEPTTVLQRAHGAATQTDQLVTTFQFGAGSELSSALDGNVGTPTFNVITGMLDNRDDAGNLLNAQAGGPAFNDGDLSAELADRNAVNPATNTPFITAANVYDSVAYTAFAADLGRTLGVAMSEDTEWVTPAADVAATTTVNESRNPLNAAAEPAFTGINATLSSWTINNDVSVDDQGVALVTDLINFNVNDVLALQRDTGASISFATVIQDTETRVNGGLTTGNNVASAEANPRVIIRDSMPPMVMTATYSGEIITITFNEDIAPVLGDTLTFGSVTVTLSQTAIDAHTAAAAKNVLTLTRSTTGLADRDFETLVLGAEFAAGLYTGTGFNNENHALLQAGNIGDAVNNCSWSGANAPTVTCNSAGVTLPIFAAETVTPLVNTNTITNTGFTSVGAPTAFTLFVTSSHRIDTLAMGGAADATALTAAQIDALIAAPAAGGSAITNAGLAGLASAAAGATLNAAGTVLTIPLTTTAAVVATNTITVVIESAWDTAAAAVTTTITAP
jgi:trimeric autotransporter adhesin